MTVTDISKYIVCKEFFKLAFVSV